jgi:hypothetical protein
MTQIQGGRDDQREAPLMDWIELHFSGNCGGASE